MGEQDSQSIPAQKLFEMYGRKSLERDMLHEENRQLKEDIEKLLNAAGKQEDISK